MTYRIPVGPYHPGLEEPYKLDLICDGETVRDAEMTIGFNFRGIEYLAERRNYTQVIALVERVCGICSNIHTLSFCQAVEKCTDYDVPERALYIRVIMAELERLHSHVLWAGVAAKLIGFKTMFMGCFALREKIMDCLELISGNRVNYSMNGIGGVNRDITDPQSVLKIVEQLEEEVKTIIIPVFTTDKTIASRCAGVGVVTKEQAKAMGIVGPFARASGLPEDIRKAAPYAAYDRMEFDVPVQTSGDVFARVVVRALETLESCRILRQALTTMPPGPFRGPARPKIPAGMGFSRVEAPRGEVFYMVRAGGKDMPERVKIRTPTFANMPAVRLAVTGNELADSPLIQASCDPCYSCTDR
jgi:Ni,Fe-hydrogenase III large subunit